MTGWPLTMVKIGITLPSFRDTAQPALAVARVAEASGLDGVFAYDHLFRRNAAGERRPALELFTLLGAVAATTERIALGSLVARATLRPPATLAHAFDTVARIAGPERVLAVIGAGDGESREENESFGLGFGTIDERLAALQAAVDAARRPRVIRYGSAAHTSRCVASRLNVRTAGIGGAARSTCSVSRPSRSVPRRRGSPFAISWGGLIVLAEDDLAATAKATRLGAGAGRHRRRSGDGRRQAA